MSLRSFGFEADGVGVVTVIAMEPTVSRNGHDEVGPIFSHITFALNLQFFPSFYIGFKGKVKDSLSSSGAENMGSGVGLDD